MSTRKKRCKCYIIIPSVCVYIHCIYILRVCTLVESEKSKSKRNNSRKLKFCEEDIVRKICN